MHVSYRMRINNLPQELITRITAHLNNMTNSAAFALTSRQIRNATNYSQYDEDRLHNAFLICGAHMTPPLHTPRNHLRRVLIDVARAVPRCLVSQSWKTRQNMLWTFMHLHMLSILARNNHCSGRLVGELKACAKRIFLRSIGWPSAAAKRAAYGQCVAEIDATPYHSDLGFWFEDALEHVQEVADFEDIEMSPNMRFSQIPIRIRYMIAAMQYFALTAIQSESDAWKDWRGLHI